MTAIERLIRDEIARDGFMTLQRYVALVTGHPVHGYYASAEPFGRAGDFVTAPEISQVFGELIGLALGQAWADQGSPARALLAELGPGRGTLMRDALRALRIVPGAPAALAVHLVEASARLRAIQAETLADAAPVWHTAIGDVPDAPLFLIANEFLDALPAHVLVRRGADWHERTVTVDGTGAFVPGETPCPSGMAARLPASWGAATDGAIGEWAPLRAEAVATIAGRIVRHGGCALLIDYGAAASGPAGDTLQAVRAHRPWPILAEPGTADLTSQVDFAPLLDAARAAGAAAWGPLPQGTFLLALGAEARFDALAHSKDADAVVALVRARRRLLHPAAMGEAFKVMAITPRTAPPPPGFAHPPA
ncbi:class I SAM-dependent methyltransferase [Marinivivus vitaminiproducens]|uniref:class I SAM-dependent methyltransferase n=1 Tax=Marinivivus vitaminiproducens TaxID=3035935 RepID=UPI0027A270F0|nr:SAM-dependent methyltransferase [Geminicoccaceae bacterium SCSIO 64248]